MSLIANLYGRLGGDPVTRTTKSGKDMTTVHVAVDVGSARDTCNFLSLQPLGEDRQRSWV
jgi:single-stranded DNA-binding protein